MNKLTNQYDCYRFITHFLKSREFVLCLGGVLHDFGLKSSEHDHSNYMISVSQFAASKKERIHI